MKKTTRYLMITTSINLLVVFLMFWAIIGFETKEVFSFLWELILNFGIAILGLYFTAYIVGQNLYRFKKKNYRFHIHHGIIAIFLVLIIGILFGSSVAFFQEGLPNILKRDYSIKESLYDYFLIPLYAILLFGGIPTLISGVVLGAFYRRMEV